MKLVGDFLKRFQSLTPPHDAVKSTVAEVVSRITGAKISKNQVRVQNGTAFVAGSSVFKNNLRVKRGEILEALYEALPKSRDSIRDVR